MKSHVRALLDLASAIYKDGYAKSAALPNVRDLQTIRSRVELEGISFLTITLANFGSDFDKSLDQGCIDSSCFRAFKKAPHGQIPAFLQGIVSLVFDFVTGGLVDEPNTAAIEAVRQMSYCFKKITLDCTDSRVNNAYAEFKNCEQELSTELDPGDCDNFRNICHVLWYGFLSDQEIDWKSIIPKHGPGATEERYTSNEKYSNLKWHKRLEQYFPLLDFAFPNIGWQSREEFEKSSLIPEEDEQPVRVIHVPKTLKAPRIIAIEPCVMQYAQQALSRLIIDKLGRFYLTSGHINFDNQEINRNIALTSSGDGQYCTIDLSSASDRVPLSLVKVMLADSPLLLEMILACRSTRARLPSGDIISLKKFASMGSALCFPIESMYFYTICVDALLRERGLPSTPKNILLVSRDVFVYGDDIIVPTDSAAAVVTNLQKYYCKVGLRKSFWTGKFRESCGMDAYGGEEVTPTYLRRLVPDKGQRSPESMISFVKTSNSFYKKGYWSASSILKTWVEGRIGKLPIVSESSAGLGLVSYMRGVTTTKWDNQYHCPKLWAWVASPVYRTDELDGHGALMKYFLNSQQDEKNILKPKIVDKKHLHRSARHGAVTLKRRWILL